jgi:hypothetical protein
VIKAFVAIFFACKIPEQAEQRKPRNVATVAHEGGFKAMERGVYAASTWTNGRFRISHVSIKF